MDTESVIGRLCSIRTMDELLLLRERLRKGPVPPEPWFKSVSLTPAHVDAAIALYDKDWFKRRRRDIFAEEVRYLSAARLDYLKRWKRQLKNGKLPRKIKKYLESNCPLDTLSAIEAAINQYDSESSRELRRREKFEWMLEWFSIAELELRRDEIIAGRTVRWYDYSDEGISAEDITDAIAHAKSEPDEEAKCRSEFRISELCMDYTIEALRTRSKELEAGFEPVDSGEIDMASPEEIAIAIERYDADEYKALRREYEDCFGHAPYEQAKEG